MRATGDQWPTFTRGGLCARTLAQGDLRLAWWPNVLATSQTRSPRLVLLGPEPGHRSCYSKLVQKGRVLRRCSLETTLHIRFQVCDQYLWLQDFPFWLEQPKPTSYIHTTTTYLNHTYHTLYVLSFIWLIMWFAMYLLLYAKLAANVGQKPITMLLLVFLWKTFTLVTDRRPQADLQDRLSTWWYPYFIVIWWHFVVFARVFC